jgi:hypothetical protein
MSSTLISQVEANHTNHEEKSPLFNALYDLASVLTLFAVTATVVGLISFQWIA